MEPCSVLHSHDLCQEASSARFRVGEWLKEWTLSRDVSEGNSPFPKLSGGTDYPLPNWVEKRWVRGPRFEIIQRLFICSALLSIKEDENLKRVHLKNQKQSN